MTCTRCGIDTPKHYTVRRLGLAGLCLTCGRSAITECPESKEQRAKRLRNRAARAKYATMRSLGLRRTAYGWE